MTKANVVPATNMGRRRQLAKVDGGPAYQARREEIIAAAGRVFLEKGYLATSFKDIAEAIGKDRASLYYYFESKQDLFRVATGAAVARNASRVEPGNGTKLRASTMQLATASRSFQGVAGLLPANRVPVTKPYRPGPRFSIRTG